MPDRSPTLPLNLLSVAYFSMGTATLAVVGTLPEIAASFGRGESAVAFLVSIFAITFAVGAPALQVVAGHRSRKRMVLAGLLLMAAGTIGSALAPTYPLLLVSRVAAALGAAAIGPVASALGASLVAKERQGHALAVVFSGMTVATVVGVPLSTWLGGTVGWRPTFALIGFGTLAVAGLVARFVPDQDRGQRISVGQLRDVFLRPATAAGIAVMVLEMMGLFASYTMIAPLLRDRFGAGLEAASVLLTIYGLAGILGNFLARRIALAWSPDRAVAVSLFGLMLVFAGLFVAPGHLPFAVVFLILWAIGSDVFMPSQQRRMVELAPDVRGLILALNSSAIYIGMAAGSFAAGSLLPAVGLSGLLLASSAFLAFALLALWLSRLGARTAADAEALEGRSAPDGI